MKTWSMDFWEGLVFVFISKCVSGLVSQMTGNIDHLDSATDRCQTPRILIFSSKLPIG